MPLHPAGHYDGHEAGGATSEHEIAVLLLHVYKFDGRICFESYSPSRRRRLGTNSWFGTLILEYPFIYRGIDHLLPKEDDAHYILPSWSA